MHKFYYGIRPASPRKASELSGDCRGASQGCPASSRDGVCLSPLLECRARRATIPRPRGACRILDSFAEPFVQAYPHRGRLAELKLRPLQPEGFPFPNGNIAPGNEQRRMTRPKRKEHSEVQSLLIGADRQAIVVAHEQPHPTALQSPPIACERAGETIGSCQLGPTTQEGDHDSHYEPKCSHEKNENDRNVEIHREPL